MSARTRRARAALLLVSLLPAASLLLGGGCGARSSLREYDAGPDAYLDDPDGGTDAGPDAPPVACVVDADCFDEVDLCKPVRCVEGKCAPQTPVTCDDKDPCTGDTCEPTTGKCTFEPLSFDLDKDGVKGPKPGKKAGDPDSCGDDCDDTSPLAFPGGKELCDGVDNDCNGIIDDEAKFLPVDAQPVLVSDPKQEQAYSGGLAYAGAKQGYLAAYTGQLDGNTSIFTRALSPTGEPSAALSKVNGTTGDASGGPLVWTGDRHGMAWSDRRDGDYEIYFNTFSPDGPKLGPDVRVSDSFGFSVNPALAWNGSSFFVVWQDDGGGNFEVFLKKLSLDAKPVGEDVTVDSPSFSDQNAESPAIAASSQGIGVVYRLGNTSTSSIRFRAYDAQPAALGPSVTLASGDNYIDPSIVVSGEKFFIFWGQKQPFRVFGAVLDLKGKTIIPPRELSPPDDSPYRRVIGLPLGDRVIVAYSRQQSDGYELFSRTFASDLTPLSPPQQLTQHIGDDFAQALTFGPNGDVAVYFDGKISDAQGLRAGAFFTRLRCDASPTKP